MEPIAIVRTALLAWQNDDKFTLMKHLAPDFMVYDWFPMPISIGTFMLMGHLFKAAFPDWSMNLTDFREEGERVFVTSRLTGTHTGKLVSVLPGFPAVPPTGRQIALPEEHVTLTLREQRIARLDVGTATNAGLILIFTQLGIDPAALRHIPLPS